MKGIEDFVIVTNIVCVKTFPCLHVIVVNTKLKTKYPNLRKSFEKGAKNY